MPIRRQEKTQVRTKYHLLPTGKRHSITIIHYYDAIEKYDYQMRIIGASGTVLFLCTGVNMTVYSSVVFSYNYMERISV